jgi:hypothetical protein
MRKLSIFLFLFVSVSTLGFAQNTAEVELSFFLEKRLKNGSVYPIGNVSTKIVSIELEEMTHPNGTQYLKGSHAVSLTHKGSNYIGKIIIWKYDCCFPNNLEVEISSQPSRKVSMTSSSNLFPEDFSNIFTQMFHGNVDKFDGYTLMPTLKIRKVDIN